MQRITVNEWVLFRSRSLRWEQRRRGSSDLTFKVRSAKCMACFSNQRQQHLCTKYQKVQSSKGQPATEGTGGRMDEGPPAPGGSQSLASGASFCFFFYPDQFPNHDAGDVDGGEFDSPKGGRTASMAARGGNRRQSQDLERHVENYERKVSNPGENQKQIGTARARPKHL